MSAECKHYRDRVKDGGFVRTGTESVGRIFHIGRVSNLDPDPIVVSLAYSDTQDGEPVRVDTVEVGPEEDFFFNPEDYEFDIAAGGYAELYASAPHGGEVTLSITTTKKA
tara:strand:+ start:2014 stop:2343 length:330 start_codon:yes stop_codon:yes gene_type:complete